MQSEFQVDKNRNMKAKNITALENNIYSLGWERCTKRKEKARTRKSQVDKTELYQN